MSQSPRQRAFVVHAVSLVGATVAILGAIAAKTTAPLPVGGIFLIAAGVAAWKGRRSLLQPRGLRARMDSVEEADGRRELEEASGLMMGVLLVFFGVIAVGFGLWITLS